MQKLSNRIRYPYSVRREAPENGPTAAGAVYQQIVATGDEAPGTGKTFANLGGSPAIGAGGNITFMGSVTDPQATTADGVWVYRRGVISLSAKIGDPAPGTSSTFVGFNVPSMADDGTAGFFAGTQDDRDGGWADDGSVQLVALTGEPAPGVTGATFKNTFPDLPPFNYPVGMASADRIGFGAALNGVPTAQAGGVWRGGPGTLSLVTQLGQQAPGTDGAFASGFGSTMINESGTLLLQAGFGSARGEGLWLASGDTLTPVMYTGMPAPSTSTTFLTVDSWTLNSRNGVAFCTNFGPAGVWHWAHGTITPVVLAGGAVPGVQGGTFTNAFGQALLNALGVVAFTGAYASPSGSGSGIFRGLLGQMQAVALTGQTAPGTGGQTFAFFFDPQMNLSGQVSFMATTAQGNTGIWITNVAGQIVPVAVQGQAFSPNGKVVSSLQMNGATAGEDGMPRTFDNAGSACFSVGFTDGSSAVYVATVGGISTGV